MAKFSRNPAFWLIRIGIAVVVGVGSYLFSSGPDSKQSTPYWSSWHSWQLSAKPAMKGVTQSLVALSNDFSQLNSSKNSQFSPVAFARDLNTLRSSTAHMKSLAHSPDALLNIRLSGYVADLTTFQNAFSKGTSPTHLTASNLSTLVGRIVRDDESVTAEWNREVRQYNSL